MTSYDLTSSYYSRLVPTSRLGIPSTTGTLITSIGVATAGRLRTGGEPAEGHIFAASCMCGREGFSEAMFGAGGGGGKRQANLAALDALGGGLRHVGFGGYADSEWYGWVDGI
jgi:hypothetical protein